MRAIDVCVKEDGWTDGWMDGWTEREGQRGIERKSAELRLKMPQFLKFFGAAHGISKTWCFNRAQMEAQMVATARDLHDSDDDG